MATLEATHVGVARLESHDVLMAQIHACAVLRHDGHRRPRPGVHLVEADDGIPLRQGTEVVADVAHVSRLALQGFDELRGAGRRARDGRCERREGLGGAKPSLFVGTVVRRAEK